MKRKSRRDRKKGHAHAPRRTAPAVRGREQSTSTNKPLGGMVVKRRHVFEPRAIEETFVSTTNDVRCDARGSEIIFKPAAVARLKKLIDWGRQTARNCVEQQGVMVGAVYATPTGYVGIVEDVLLSGAVGNHVYIESSHSEWAEMDRQLDELNEGRERKLVKVGWWHTHPNMAIFMSGTDRETQAAYFYRDWQFAVVLNPQAEHWGAFIGERATVCNGFFINKNLFKLKRIEEQ